MERKLIQAGKCLKENITSQKDKIYFKFCGLMSRVKLQLTV